jgi:hypothetical protein
MTAVSQRIPLYTGGVSQQADEKMGLGQVKEALNCYPDVTLGMIKRPGGRFTGLLNGLTPNSADTQKWFSIFRDNDEKYISTIAPNGTPRVWNLVTGNEATVNYPAGKEAAVKAYLNAADPRNLKTLTINDFTYIVNSEKTVTAKTAPAFTPNLQATIVVNLVEYDTTYSVTIGASTYSFKSGPVPVQASPGTPINPIKLADVTNGISAAITAGFATKTIIDNTIYLTFATSTTISVTGGVDGKAIRFFQDAVDTFSRLPEQGKHNQVVKVTNTNASQDDFYLKFIAENGTGGKGYWEETVSPAVSLGINEETMPIVLIRDTLSPLVFTATFLDGSVTINTLALKWEPRLVGDEESNSHPSFVNNTIQDVFLFQNRLGFLTEDNVSMSQAGDYYNFYHKSATALGIADPIDLSCASIKPATIRSVTPITQGLLLFSDSQQFLMESEDGPWTATAVTIRTISNYECDRYLKPVDLGSTVLYTSRNQSWTRTFEIFTRGQRENPSVNESSKLVPEWIPRTITDTTGSSQNGLWVGSSKTSNILYLFRFFEQGDERVLSSWVKWVLPANVIHTAIQNDILYVLSSDVEGYNVTQHNLVLSPTTGGLLNGLGNNVDPHLDLWSEVTDASIVNPTPPTQPAYDPVTRTTKVYLPTYFDTTKVINFVVGIEKGAGVGSTALALSSGYYGVVTVETDGGGDYFTISGDVSNNFIYVGYEYNMEITLPRYYYSMGEAGVDFTAVTTTSRMAFYTGLGGDVYFSILDRSRATWRRIDGARIADFYAADTSPFRQAFVYKVPIYQRPDNYTMKVTSNTPFPVSLVAMQWEGQYSPGFFRRS